MTLKDQRFYFFKEKSVYRFLKKKKERKKLNLIPIANLAVMGNNLDCSNKISQVEVYTLEPALGNSPPLLFLLPRKADPNKFIRFHIDAFFFLYPSMP